MPLRLTGGTPVPRVKKRQAPEWRLSEWVGEERRLILVGTLAASAALANEAGFELALAGFAAVVGLGHTIIETRISCRPCHRIFPL